MAAIAAATIALVVIPAVEGDPFPGATPDRAVPAFWILCVVFVLLALAGLVLRARIACGRLRGTVALAFFAGATALTALPLIDAGMAYAGHGPAMHLAAAVLLLLAAVSLAAAASVLRACLASRQGGEDS